MLWFPRPLQGDGRHDNPDLYGCLYVSTEPAGAVAEALAPFRGSGPLLDAMLERGGRPLSLGELVLADDAEVVDLDDPAVLVRESLHPSEVATRRRALTQGHAERLFRDHPEAVGLRWWSTLESTLLHLTLFDRAAPRITLAGHHPLTPDHPAVVAAAGLLGLVA